MIKQMDLKCIFQSCNFSKYRFKNKILPPCPLIINPIKKTQNYNFYSRKSYLQTYLFLSMDFNHLQSLFLSLESRPDKIKSLVDYILPNTSSNESEIAKALQRAFYNLPLEKQLAIFYTISEILLISSQKRELGYFKVFGIKIKSFLETLSSQVQDFRVMKDICRTLDKWQSEQIFAGNFMEKLKAVIKNFYNKIREENTDEEKMLGFKKYKKTFLMEINDLKNYPTTYEIYQNHCEYIQLEQKLTNLGIEFGKIDFESSNQNAEINRKRSQELSKIYNDLRQKLQNVIMKIQMSFNKMRQWAMQEYDAVKRQYGLTEGRISNNRQNEILDQKVKAERNI